MSFQNLKVDELKDVAEFFVVDVEVANEEHGPTKKELLAALAAGDEPVTWEQYNELYLKTQPKPDEQVDDEPVVENDDVTASPESAPEAQEQAELEHENPRQEVSLPDVLIKYERKNPTWETLGYRFTTQHPFKSVPAHVADYLVRNKQGFRIAVPSEVTDYYN